MNKLYVALIAAALSTTVLASKPEDKKATPATPAAPAAGTAATPATPASAEKPAEAPKKAEIQHHAIESAQGQDGVRLRTIVAQFDREAHVLQALFQAGREGQVVF